MRLSNEFTVAAPLDDVWPVLLDIERVAPCLPGASLTGRDGDAYAGAMKVKLGPILSSYRGTVTIESADRDSATVVMRARGKDARGQGTAAAVITSRLTEADGVTSVNVETDMRVTGPAAQFGRGVMESVTAKLMGQFSDRLAQEIAGGPAAEPEAAAAEPAGGTGGAAKPAGGTADATEPAGGTAGAAKPAGGTGDGAAPAAAAPASAPAAAAAPSAVPAPTAAPDYLDLAAVGREELARRAIPLLAAAVVALLAFALGRRSRG